MLLLAFLSFFLVYSVGFSLSYISGPFLPCINSFLFDCHEYSRHVYEENIQNIPSQPKNVAQYSNHPKVKRKQIYMKSRIFQIKRKKDGKKIFIIYKPLPILDRLLFCSHSIFITECHRVKMFN